MDNDNTLNKILVSLCCLFILGTIGLIIFNNATKTTINVENTTTTSTTKETTTTTAVTTNVVTTTTVPTKKTTKANTR